MYQNLNNYCSFSREQIWIQIYISSLKKLNFPILNEILTNLTEPISRMLSDKVSADSWGQEDSMFSTLCVLPTRKWCLCHFFLYLIKTLLSHVAMQNAALTDGNNNNLTQISQSYSIGIFLVIHQTENTHKNMNNNFYSNVVKNVLSWSATARGFKTRPFSRTLFRITSFHPKVELPSNMVSVSPMLLQCTLSPQSL